MSCLLAKKYDFDKDPTGYLLRKIGWDYAVYGMAMALWCLAMAMSFKPHHSSPQTSHPSRCMVNYSSDTNSLSEHHLLFDVDHLIRGGKI